MPSASNSTPATPISLTAPEAPSEAKLFSDAQDRSWKSTISDGEGFEPSVPCGTHAFQACPIDRSGTHPMSGQDIEANRQVLQLNFRLLLVQGALQRVQLSLEFTLSFLDNLQLQLITM